VLLEAVAWPSMLEETDGFIVLLFHQLKAESIVLVCSGRVVGERVSVFARL
jgi:hypothetical protein